MTENERTDARGEALGSIVSRLDELRRLAAFHGLDFLGYLLDVAFTEASETIRREHARGEPMGGGP